MKKSNHNPAAGKPQQPAGGVDGAHQKDDAEATPNAGTGAGAGDHNRSLTYHVLVGLGFVALIAWFYLMRELQFMSWVTSLGPATHAGAMNMLAIILWMLPGFLVWKYYMRFINRKLKITGIFYEDHFYKDQQQSDQQPEITPDSSKDQPATGDTASTADKSSTRKPR